MSPAKHVYQSLEKKELLAVVQGGEMGKKQYEELQILKFHNVEVWDKMLKKLQDFKIRVETKGSPELQQHGLRFAVQGSCYNDLVLFQKDAESIALSKLKALGVKKDNFYSDAEYSRVICHSVFQNGKQELVEVLPAAA